MAPNWADILENLLDIIYYIAFITSLKVTIYVTILWFYNN